MVLDVGSNHATVRLDSLHGQPTQTGTEHTYPTDEAPLLASSARGRTTAADSSWPILFGASTVDDDDGLVDFSFLATTRQHQLRVNAW